MSKSFLISDIKMITASIVVYQTDERELKTILDCTIKSIVHTVFVVDNSPGCELKKLVDSYESSRLIYIFGQGNVGYGRGHNIAIDRSLSLGADYHVVLNPDIIFQEDVIVLLESFMECHPEVGAVMPNVIYPDGIIQRLCKLLPTPFDILGRRFLPKTWIKRYSDKYEMHFMGYDKNWNCPNLSGCFMFLRNSILRQVGNFDEQFFLYFEDTDLIRRIHRVSKTVFYPGATIVHAHKAGHRSSWALFKISMQSAIKYFNKYGWFFDKERRTVNKCARSMNAQIKE